MGKARGVESGEAFHRELGISVDIQRIGWLRFFHRRRGPDHRCCAAGPDDPAAPLAGELEDIAEPLDVIGHHAMLVGHGGVGDGRLVRDHIERPGMRSAPPNYRPHQGCGHRRGNR